MDARVIRAWGVLSAFAGAVGQLRSVFSFKADKAISVIQIILQRHSPLSFAEDDPRSLNTYQSLKHVRCFFALSIPHIYHSG
jgi:hypothetical protein